MTKQWLNVPGHQRQYTGFALRFSPIYQFCLAWWMEHKYAFSSPVWCTVAISDHLVHSSRQTQQKGTLGSTLHFDTRAVWNNAST